MSSNLPPPAEAASALVGEGLALDDPWKLTRDTTNWWAATARRKWGAALARVGDIPSEISYFIEGNSADSVRRITLEAEIYNPEVHAAAMVPEFARLVPVLFSKLNLDMPADLADAIAAERAFTSEMPFGTVSFEREPYRMGYGLLLTIKVRE